MKSIQNVFTFTWNSRRSHFEDKENQRKKLNQTHIFTLSSLLIKLLILWKLNIYLCKKKNYNSREDKVSTSPFTWKVSRTSISWHNFLTWVQADCSSTFLSFWTLLLLYWCGFSESAWKRTRLWIHLDISIHILHTVLYAFSKVLTRRICLIIKSFYSWWSFPWLLIQGWY